MIMPCRVSSSHVFALILLILFLPPDSHARSDDGNRPIAGNSHRISIGKLRQEIRLHLDKIKKTDEQESSLLDELKRIDEQIAGQKKKLQTLQRRQKEQEKLLALTKRDLQQVMQVRDAMRAHLKKRLRAFYLMGRTGMLNVIFSAKNLPEQILFNDSYQKMIAYDHKVIRMYRETIVRLDQSRKQHEMELDILEKFIAQAREEEQRLQTLRQQRRQLLTRVRNEKNLYRQAVREMRRAEQELAATLEKIKEKEQLRQQGFLLNKGRLPAPATGVLTTRFGEQTEQGPSRGITIKTADGARVYAIYGGRVLFSGYRKGYGNMVIIDHGLNHYSITARLETTTVHEGDQVQARQQIGTSGDIATLFSRGLYFEIRHGATPLDPLKWLQPGLFVKKRPKSPVAPSLP